MAGYMGDDQRGAYILLAVLWLVLLADVAWISLGYPGMGR